MKFILVPTDFSECASFASDLAVEIAGKSGASVHFFTVFTFILSGICSLQNNKRIILKVKE